MNAGDRITVDVVGINSEGEGIARHGKDGFVIFIPGALPEERVSVRILQAKKRYATAQINERHVSSSLRVEPKCPVYGWCGGCQLQHVGYETQLNIKTKSVTDALARIAGFEILDKVKCTPSPQEWGYRNKASFPLQTTGEHRLNWGYYAARSHRIVPIESCPVLEPELASLPKLCIDKLREAKFEGYDEQRAMGNLRYLVVRKGTHTEDLLLGLVTGRIQQKREVGYLRTLYSSLHGEFPGLKGAVLNLNTDRGNFIWGPLFKTLSGKNSLKEKLGNFTFDADISSFFQVNTRQAEQLFAYAAALALKDNPKRILELYSGVGSLTAFLASGGAQIDAVEEWRPATRLLKQNMVQNGITNVSVHECSAEEAFGTLEKGYEVAVLDPPRSGCDRRVLDGLARLAPKKIVYVSCNPSTLARDIAVLDEQGYTLQKLEAFDLFPQTAHVETVACLVKA